ncbi:hypothetical protein M405DRAFT_16328 [Rhizopogon salebrosus TDB-379]|nr:hypothetical protein M405DRAFT_16328 [Rhizopogon salebrosus TDB-379]
MFHKDANPAWTHPSHPPHLLDRRHLYPHRQLGQGPSNHIHPSHRQLHRPHMPQSELQPVLCRQYIPAVSSRLMTSFTSVWIPYLINRCPPPIQ